MTPEREDYIYNSFVSLTNDLNSKGYSELEVLKYMKDWIASTIETSKEYNMINTQEYIAMKKEFGL